MVRELIDLLGAAAERSLHSSLLGVATFTAAALFTAVSLGFATFAGYDYFRASKGPVAAALIVAAAYALLATAIAAIGLVRRRRTPLRRSPAPALAACETPPDALAPLTAAVQLGRQLPTNQLLGLTLAAGFIAGKNLRRRYIKIH
jgi:hypothetical protein